MQAVSSHRPNCQDRDICRNQSLAARTWRMTFTRIIYLGPSEPDLRSPKTKFVFSEDFPRIKALMQIAALQPGFTAILNADIVVNDLRKLENQMMLRGKVCASSRRWHFDPNTCDWKAAYLGSDRGRDIFIARQDVWRKAAREVPEEFRIGHQGHDGWLTDYFRRQHNDSFIDFTGQRLIFHPEHGSRKMPYAVEVATVAGIH